MPDIFDQLAAQQTQQDQGDIFDKLAAQNIQPQSTWDKLVALAKTPSPEWMQPAEEAVRGWISGPAGDIPGINKPLYEPQRVEEGQQVPNVDPTTGRPTGGNHSASGLEAAGANEVGGFISGLTSLKGITQMLPPVFLANAIHQAPEMIQQVQRAEETPAWSQARWEAGLNVASTLGFGGGMLSAMLRPGEAPSVADAIRAREPQAVAEAVQAQMPEFSPEQHRAVEMQVQQGVPEEQAAQSVLSTPPPVPEEYVTGQDVGPRQEALGERYGIQPGIGASAEDSISAARARALDPDFDPYPAASKVAQRLPVSNEDLADVVVEHERLANAAIAAEDYARANPSDVEAKLAANDAAATAEDFARNVIKPAGTLAGDRLKLFQEVVPQDATTQVGLNNISAQRLGRELLPNERARNAASADRAAADVADVNGQAARSATAAARIAGSDVPTRADIQARFSKLAQDLGECE